MTRKQKRQSPYQRDQQLERRRRESARLLAISEARAFEAGRGAEAELLGSDVPGSPEDDLWQHDANR